MRKTAGFALIDLLFVVGIIGVLCGTAVPPLLEARQAATATSAMASLRAINSAELTFAITCGSGFYAPSLPMLATPPPSTDVGFISPDLGGAFSVMKSNYLIQLDGIPYARSPATCNGGRAGDSSRGYASAADSAESTNKRFFGSNADQVIWEDTSSLFIGMPEIGEPPSGHPVTHW